MPFEKANPMTDWPSTIPWSLRLGRAQTLAAGVGDYSERLLIEMFSIMTPRHECGMGKARVS